MDVEDVLGTTGPGGAATVLGSITLPGVSRSVATARRFVRDVLDGLPGLDDVVLAVSETVANAVTHTASGLEGGLVTVVVAAVPGAVRLEVADDGASGARPYVKDDPGAETGRGMRIVQSLAARWGYRADGTRTVVWAEFPAPDARVRGRER
ncbi:ATP-binding protein [Actinomadura verrucosospora]|uniref:Anti-sigma regulatory factor, serine/threonine protein kinase n=1 Tax=Actinomadura verrucosospora TaxID=46165 RepID=A0A7D3ZN95_ACTVE|nr:ATP-binding protein [Actinomadura verrucosospora]QKG23063.1 anti-sigma regulatory factor, serine/threonine protein kinase [Actinomadura verrucosospora]